jgi:hypothetical protein
MICKSKTDQDQVGPQVAVPYARAGNNLRGPRARSAASSRRDPPRPGVPTGAVGTPFFLFTDGDAAHAKLFADAYQPDPPVTLGPTGVGTTSATVNDSVNPQEAAVNVSFQFEATTAYGQTTRRRRPPPATRRLGSMRS